jgi:hypothetical protein
VHTAVAVFSSASNPPLMYSRAENIPVVQYVEVVLACQLPASDRISASRCSCGMSIQRREGSGREREKLVGQM